MQTVLKSYGVGRRHPSDVFFEEGDQFCNPLKREGIFDVDDEDLCHPVIETFSCTVPGCCKQMKSILEFETHYNSVHRYVCAECKKYLPTPHLLDLHVAETHDSFFQTLAERQPMYQCYVESCTVKFKDPSSRRGHCIEVHKYPPNFRFDVVHRKQVPNPNPLAGAEGDSKMMVDCEEAASSVRKQKNPPQGRKKPAAGFLGPKRGVGCQWHRKVVHSQKESSLDGKEFVSELRSSLPE